MTKDMEKVSKVLREHEDAIDTKLAEVYEKEKEIVKSLKGPVSKKDIDALNNLNEKKYKLWAVGGELYAVMKELGL